MLERWRVGFLKPVMGWFIQSAAMGALPSLRAAVDPELSGGEYIGPHGPREARGYPVHVPATPSAHDREAAWQLWEVSETLTGIEYL